MRKTAAVLIGVLLLGGCTLKVESVPSETLETPDAATSSVVPEVSSEGTADAGSGPETSADITLLNSLEVKGRASSGGYDREGKYGEAWLDVDQNGCRTRDDILKRDLYNILTIGGCQVESGILEDPYTGETIFFERGETTSTKVQIDHVVALKNSWLSGAQSWEQSKRVEFANDPMNLLAVDGAANQQKGAADAATWLPPRKAYRCTYVSKQIKVKAKYQLWVTPAEKEAMIKVLSNCESGPASSTEAERSQEPPPPSVEPETNLPGNGGSDPQFGSCKEAKAAGYGPYTREDPEYIWYRDGDADGEVCE